jgi:hypothetical protein
MLFLDPVRELSSVSGFAVTSNFEQLVIQAKQHRL